MLISTVTGVSYQYKNMRVSYKKDGHVNPFWVNIPTAFRDLQGLQEIVDFLTEIINKHKEDKK